MLPKKNKLTKKDISVFSAQNQKKKVYNDLFSFSYIKGTQKANKVAVIVSKKAIKSAVLRNKAKRLVFECFDIFGRKNDGFTVIFYIKQGFLIDLQKTRGEITKSINSIR